MFDAAHQVR